MQKITLEDMSESKSGLEEKSVDRSHSVNSMHTATHETTNVAVFEVNHSEKGIILKRASYMNFYPQIKFFLKSPDAQWWKTFQY